MLTHRRTTPPGAVMRHACGTQPACVREARQALVDLVPPKESQGMTVHDDVAWPQWRLHHTHEIAQFWPKPQQPHLRTRFIAYHGFHRCVDVSLRSTWCHTDEVLQDTQAQQSVYVSHIHTLFGVQLYDFAMQGSEVKAVGRDARAPLETCTAAGRGGGGGGGGGVRAATRPPTQHAKTPASTCFGFAPRFCVLDLTPMSDA